MQPRHSRRGRSTTPYREEAGRVCIDIRLRSARQLFDGRDPAPFRERDLDEGAVDYIVDCAEETPARKPLKLVVWLTEKTTFLPDDTLLEAIRAHFRNLEARLSSDIRKHVRQGQLNLLLGLMALAGFLTLSRLCALLEAGMVRDVLREGFSIIAWVAMWRPVERLLYDWGPLVQERRLVRRIVQAELEVHHQPSPSTLPSLTPNMLPDVPLSHRDPS